MEYIAEEYAKVQAAYRRTMWLPRGNDAVLDFVWALMCSHYRITSYDQAWGAIVGVASSGKSESLEPLCDHPDVEAVDQISGQSLMSGWVKPDGDPDADDPSLLKRLDGRVLLMSDLTTTFEMPSSEQNKFWGVLRRAFDGRAASSFGHIGVRVYHAKFTLITACTPVIYKRMQSEATMGQRILFIRMRSPKNLDESLADAVEIDRCKMQNEYEKRRQAVKEFIPLLRDYVRGLGSTYTLERDMKAVHKFAYLTVKLRSTGSAAGTVDPEEPTRVRNQLLRLGDARAILYGRTTWDGSDYEFVQRISKDTMQPPNVIVIQFIGNKQVASGPPELTDVRQVLVERIGGKTLTMTLNQLHYIGAVQTRQGIISVTPEYLRMLQDIGMVKVPT